MSPGNDTRWIDGLRGIASILVVISHLIMAFAPTAVIPTSEQSVLSIWNLPIIRTPVEGFPWVAIFFVLSGLVNALKPLKLLTDQQHDLALTSLAHGCFRRTLRLVLPCTVITVVSWGMAQVGCYRTARNVDSGWLSGTSPMGSEGVGVAVRDLVSEIWRTWIHGSNFYDMNHWTMVHFLRETFVLFLALVSTVRATVRARMIIVIGLFCVSWKMNDDLVGIPAYAGLILAQLALSNPAAFFSTKRSAKQFIPFMILYIGLYLLSFPNISPDWYPWFRGIAKFGEAYFPTGANKFQRTLYIGVFFILSSIMLSKSMQSFLVKPLFLWLGKISFPIYLVHGPMLRSVLCWVLFATQSGYKEVTTPEGARTMEAAKYEIPPTWNLLLVLPLFIVAVVFVADAWTQKVEPVCGRLTIWIEGVVNGQNTISLPVSLPLPAPLKRFGAIVEQEKTTEEQRKSTDGDAV